MADRALVHLDSASAGRASAAVLDAVDAHARLEAASGAYVAEEAAAPALAGLRDRLGGLLAMPADGVALTESATASLGALLRSWPLPPGARIGVAPSEWGPNLEAFRDAGLATTLLPVDALGVLDPGRLADLLADDPPDVVHVTLVSAHRGLVQPLAEVAAVCRASGTPLWVDAAQALGHVRTDLAGVDGGVSAVYATSRKWLAGPRGVGVLAVAERHWSGLRLPHRASHAPDLPPVRTLESAEAHVAGRVGLATAVEALVERGVDAVTDGLAAVGRRTRARLADLDGWEVVSPDAPAAATTALRPTAGQDVVATRTRLVQEHGVLTTACLPWRAPLEPPAVALRLSPHLDVTDDDLDRLVAALGVH